MQLPLQATALAVHFFINLVAFGAGMELFKESGRKQDLKKRNSTSFECGIVGLCYKLKIGMLVKTITPGKKIAEQSLGVWTSFFDPHHYRLIGGVVIHCFPNKPAHINRSAMSKKLNRIREFRNRVYHNEPICFDGNKVDFSEAISIKNEIYELYEWIDVDLIEYVEYFNWLNSGNCNTSFNHIHCKINHLV